MSHWFQNNVYIISWVLVGIGAVLLISFLATWLSRISKLKEDPTNPNKKIDKSPNTLETVIGILGGFCILGGVLCRLYWNSLKNPRDSSYTDISR